MKQVLGFDVYGTLVDPLAMTAHLKAVVGELADRFSELWREKQIEYAFRRGLMRRYENFGVCTRDALRLVAARLGVKISPAEEARLIDEYQKLRPFPDVEPGLARLRDDSHVLVAFSNGAAATVRTLLGNAGVLPHLSDVVSVDEVKSFKPDPAVYHHLVARTGGVAERTWLVSGNAWDVMGAKSAGLKAVWVKRSSDQLFDTWGFEPDLTVKDLGELAGTLPR